MFMGNGGKQQRWPCITANFSCNKTKQKHFPDLGSAVEIIIIDFLRSFRRHHFARKPMVTLQNVGCFLRLGTLLFSGSN